MATNLGDLLDSARHENFVGRRQELAGFDAALAGGACRIMFVHGPGGIGKTTLLLEFRNRSRAAGRPVVLLEGREIDPSPDGFRAALGGPVPAGTVLLVDEYEQLAPVDGWLRQEFVPALPADVVIVLAGRDPPTAVWRTDPGWRRVVAIHRLDHFDPADSSELLARAGIASEVRPRLVTLGRGHPLAMALLADTAATGTVPDRLADLPDLVSALLESLLRGAPGDPHVAGLATCAKAWLTTEDLLREVVGTDAPAVWAWLEQRPFVSRGTRGLWPHDLAREVLDAEFERRSPDRYKALHRIIHNHVVAGLRAATGLERQLLAQHLTFLHRHSPLTSVFYTLRTQGSAAVVPARPDEHEAAVALIERFDGPADAELLRAWLAEQPATLSVVRTTGGLAATAYHVMHPTGSGLEERDPVVAAVLAHVAREGPVRPGEQVDIARFFTGAREGHRDLYAVLAGSVSSLVEWVSRPLAWSFVVITDAGFWGPFFEYLAFGTLLDLDVGGVRHVVYGNDWRRFPVDTWLDLMNEREHSGGTGPPPTSLLRPPPLDRARFAAAVRSALSDLHRPDRLAASPLAGTALAGAVPGGLRACLDGAIALLRDEPLRRVLNRTFVRPAPTQEAAAEVLGLPFSTYRRHLAKACDQLTDLLWAVEIGEIRLPAGGHRLTTDRSGD